MKLNPSLRLLVPLTLALVATGCDGDKPASTLGLLPPEPVAEGVDPEAERLRKLQMITVLDGGTLKSFTDEGFYQLVSGSCGTSDVCPDVLTAEGAPASPGCLSACGAASAICRAQTFLALTRPQGALVTLNSGGVKVPEQSEESKQTLALLGLSNALVAASQYSGILRAIGKVDNGVTECTDGTNQFHGTSLSTYAGSGFSQAYDLYKQLQDAYITVSKNAADAELNSSTSVTKATKRALTQRLAAARELGGEVSKLPTDVFPAGAFCTRGPSSPAVRAAIQVIRDAAISPADLLASETTISTQNLIEGIGGAVPGGSVRQRLADFYFGKLDPAMGATSVLPNGKSVEQQYDLEITTFQEARTYLQEEFTAFARSLTAELPRRKKPDGTLSSYHSYAATGSPPSRLPSAYYGAVVRTTNGARTQNAGGWGSFLVPFGQDVYNSSAPAFFSAARIIVDARSNAGNTLDDAGLGPVALIAGGSDLLGFVKTGQFIDDVANTTSRQIVVSGFSAEDGIKLAIGEDDLRCAVQGSVEGAPCSLKVGTADRLVGFANYPFTDVVYTKSAEAKIGVDKTRVYLLKPRVAPGMNPQDTLSPGSYEALIGFNAHESANPTETGGFAIVRGNEDRIAALIEPNREWCARPRESCFKDRPFDARIALEDELTDDDNGIENSWRHYLDNAKAAAAEADQLGVDYINESLSAAQDAVQNERAKQQQLEQANAQLQQLQQLCGFSSDTQSLMKLLTDDSGNLVKTTTGSCTNLGACTNPAYTCVGFLSASNRAGTCTFNLDKFLDAHKDNPDIRRIRDCIVGSDPVDFVSLGDVPLCLWHDSHNKNLVCKDANGADAKRGTCPQILDRDRVPSVQDVGGTDAATRSAIKVACLNQLQNVMPNASTATATQPLGYFNVSQEAQSASAADMYDRLRDASPTTWKALEGPVISGSYLDPNRIAETVFGLDWEDGWDDYGTVRFRGVELYTSGSGTKGPAPTLTTDVPPQDAPWPCGSANTRPWRWNDASTGSPNHYDCTNRTERVKANAEMFRAVAAAKLLGPLTDDQIYGHDGAGYPLINFGLMRHTQLDHYDKKEICHGLLNAVVHKVSLGLLGDCEVHVPVYNCGTFGNKADASCDGSRSVLRPDGSGVLVSSCDTGTAYTSGTRVNELDDRFANLGCFQPTPLHATDHSKTDAALSGLSTQFGGSLVERLNPFVQKGWVYKYLSGRNVSLSDKIAQYTWDSASTRVPGVADVAHKLDITGLDVMMGLGLIERALSKDVPLIDLKNPPKVNNVDDLEAVGLYVDAVADQIRDSISSISFSNVPGEVVDALRSASAAGSYPQLGGDMATQVSNARGALLRLHQNGPLLANEVRQVGADIRSLKVALKKSKVRQDISSIQLASEINNQMTACALTFTHVSLDFVADAAAPLASAMTCANSIAQIGFASQLSQLTQQDAMLDGDFAVADFSGKFSSHSTQMQTLATQLLSGAEDLDTALATIQTKRDLARSTLVSAIAAGSFQAQHQAEVTTVLANLSTAKQERYRTALENAKRLSFVAKRAIEQRLAVRLADITEDYPLVEAPATWEATNCSATGVDYQALTQDVKDNPDAPKSFSNGFIGDYVKKLENFVESYSLVNNFHEGTDTAVISLKNDIMNVRKSCASDNGNILADAGQLDRSGTPGWGRQGCPLQAVDGRQESVPDCINVDPAADSPRFVDAAAASTKGYALTFGTASTPTSAIVQSVDLPAGLFRFSWYTKGSGTAGMGGQIAAPWSGGAAALVQADVAPTITADGIVPAVAPETWNRRFVNFRLNQAATVRVGFAKQSGSVTVSGPMLEQLQDIPVDQALVPFGNTGVSHQETFPACEDTDGSVFRSTRWHRGCVKLCDSGFADSCTGANSKDYCYWETDFSFSQRDIQRGKVFNFSGFARGNFNYRIDSIGLNFIGTSPHACADAESPGACYSAGYLPISLSHVGPFYVRNHKGDDVEAKIFDGNIEHARGLATERVLSNPLSNADQTLIEQYMRHEFAGRPLDGAFVLRVWDEDGVDFTAIEDVQVALKYRYWTKFN